MLKNVVYISITFAFLNLKQGLNFFGSHTIRKIHESRIYPLVKVKTLFLWYKTRSILSSTNTLKSNKTDISRVTFFESQIESIEQYFWN